MLLIDAVYIHESGGRVLLEYLLTNLKNTGHNFHVLLDKRVEATVSGTLKDVKSTFLKGSETVRKKFYINLPSEVKTVFCFANVPPPLPITDRKVVIYFQNALLVAGIMEVNGYSLFRKCKFYLKRAYIKWKVCKDYQWVVQTRSMQERVAKYLELELGNIKVIPFFKTSNIQDQNTINEKTKFIYVADGVPQKNHSKLLDAWEILGKKNNIFYHLHLTIPVTYHHLLSRIEELKEKGYKITNNGVCGVDELNELYQQSGYLIFPSLTESFGLPLIEASLAGCGIIASDLPFVTDIVSPLIVFNPFSAEDIAQAVLKAEGMEIINYIYVKNEIDNLIKILFS